MRHVGQEFGFVSCRKFQRFGFFLDFDVLLFQKHAAFGEFFVGLLEFFLLYFEFFFRRLEFFGLRFQFGVHAFQLGMLGFQFLRLRLRFLEQFLDATPVLCSPEGNPDVVGYGLQKADFARAVVVYGTEFDHAGHAIVFQRQRNHVRGLGFAECKRNPDAVVTGQAQLEQLPRRNGLSRQTFARLDLFPFVGLVAVSGGKL